MFQRQRTGSVVCRSCGLLVGVNDPECFQCGARNPGLWGYAPVLRRLGNDLGFVPLVMGGCALLYLLTLAADPSAIFSGGGMFSLLSPSGLSLLQFGASGWIPVFYLGRWWTLLSAAWLHGGLLHIGFNLMWIRNMAPLTGEVYGPARLVTIYTVSSVTGFGLSTLMGNQLTVGASAPIFGLFGALYWAGRKTGSSQLGQQALFYAVILFAFGFMLNGVDNYAHAGGFVGGVAAGAVLNPLRQERFSDMLTALLCLALTLMSIVLSIVVPLPPIG